MPRARQNVRFRSFLRRGTRLYQGLTPGILAPESSYSYGRVLREWGYVNIARKVMVERMIEAPGKDVLEDYKFFVYDGRVHFIHIDMDRLTQCTRNLYDRDWNLIPGKLKFANIPFLVPRPPKLDTMITLAERIGSQFDFVRVDLYCTPQGIFFGEATFYPEGGIGVFTPDDLDKRFGEPWKIAWDSQWKKGLANKSWRPPAGAVCSSYRGAPGTEPAVA